MQTRRWASFLFSVAVTIGGLVIPMMFPSIDPTLGWVLLATSGISGISALILVLAPWVLNICRRARLWMSMRSQDEEWIPLSLASKWLALNAGPFLAKKLAEIAPSGAEDYCLALLISQINSGAATARGVRQGGAGVQEIPHDEGFRHEPNMPCSLVIVRYGVVEPAFHQVTIRREQLKELKKIGEDIHSYYGSRPVAAIEFVRSIDCGIEDVSLSGFPAAFASRDSVGTTVTRLTAEGINAKGGVGLEFDNSPGAKLRDVSVSNFEKGYRFKDSPDADLKRIEANGRGLSTGEKL